MTLRSIASFVLAALASAPTAAYAQATDVVTYYHADAIGSVRMITDAAGQVVERYDYLPFGEPWPNDVVSPNRQRFAGKEKDPENGLGYVGARYYAHSAGRFTTVDPALDAAGALLDPQRWNRYSYTWNRPLTMTDPDGREAGYVYLPSGAMLSPYDSHFPRSQHPVRDTTLLAAGVTVGFTAGAVIASGLAQTLVVEAQLALGRLLLFTAGTAGAAEELRRAAASGGPTVRVVTNLTQFPAPGRSLSTAVGENAQALANAFRSGEGVRTFAADLPKALLMALQKARLLEMRNTVAPNGATGIEYRFAPGAYEYILRFFKEVATK